MTERNGEDSLTMNPSRACDIFFDEVKLVKRQALNSTRKSKFKDFPIYMRHT